MTKSRFALWFSLVALVAPLQAVSQSATQASASSDVPHPDMLVVPTCPVGGSKEFTKNLQIIYFPGQSNAITNPQSLTLRLVFNGRSWRANDRTVGFERREDGGWRASVPLAFQWVYAIWYVRDDLSGHRDDNHGHYWDAAFCDDNGKKLSEAIRYQAEGYAGSIFSDDIKRTADYDRAISIVEGSEVAHTGFSYMTTGSTSSGDKTSNSERPRTGQGNRERIDTACGWCGLPATNDYVPNCV